MGVGAGGFELLLQVVWICFLGKSWQFTCIFSLESLLSLTPFFYISVLTRSILIALPVPGIFKVILSSLSPSAVVSGFLNMLSLFSSIWVALEYSMISMLASFVTTFVDIRPIIDLTFKSSSTNLPLISLSNWTIISVSLLQLGKFLRLVLVLDGLSSFLLCFIFTFQNKTSAMIFCDNVYQTCMKNMFKT